jgi:uncharacterized protein YbaA (DUF1428 family)
MVAPVKTARKADYIKTSTELSALFLAHGALSYVECWGDDVPMGERTSLPRAVELAADETCAVSFITYPDKATRDACMGAVMANPRADALMQDMPLDGKRMIFGGFEAIVTA